MRKRLVALLCGVGLFAIGFAPTMAGANRVYTGWDTMWYEDAYCLSVKVTTDHGATGNGYFQVEGKGKDPFEAGGGEACASPWNRGAGQFRIRMTVWKTNASQNCIETPWLENAVTTNYMQINRPKEPINNPFDQPPCGNGHYWTKGKFEANGYPGWPYWVGGPYLVIEDSHQFPTTPGGSGG
jgi:hypothetical protein